MLNEYDILKNCKYESSLYALDLVSSFNVRFSLQCFTVKCYFLIFLCVMVLFISGPSRKVRMQKKTVYQTCQHSLMSLHCHGHWVQLSINKSVRSLFSCLQFTGLSASLLLTKHSDLIATGN